VLAQGKENAERRNLSFIERALFAKALTARGFERKLVCEALALEKSELSRLLQVADSVPPLFVQAIGPAPKAGRARWMALGEIFANDNGAKWEIATDETTGTRFRAATSDERFRMLFDRLVRSRRPGPQVREIARADGRPLARLERKGRAAVIAFAADVDPDFAERVAARLAEDYAAFLAGRAGKGD